MANWKETKGQTRIYKKLHRKHCGDLRGLLKKSYRTYVNRSIAVMFDFVIHYNMGSSFVEDDRQSPDDFTRIIHVTCNYIYKTLRNITAVHTRRKRDITIGFVIIQNLFFFLSIKCFLSVGNVWQIIILRHSSPMQPLLHLVHNLFSTIKDKSINSKWFNERFVTNSQRNTCTVGDMLQNLNWCCSLEDRR